MKRLSRRKLLVSTEAVHTSASGNWELLRTGAPGGGDLGVPTIPTDVSTNAGRVRLAIGPNDEPRVLLPLEGRESAPTIQESNALSISVSSFTSSGRILRFLDLICLSPDLESVFGELVDEMLTRIARDKSCGDAVRSTIEDFRSLLRRGAAGRITRGRVAGLIAELQVLNRLLDRTPSAWKAWLGPTGDRHDFRAGGTSLEVKSSLRPSASRVAINSLHQLEIATGGSLHLLRFVLEPVGNGILNVSSLARNALSKSSDPERLSELLAAVGCSNVDGEDWNRYSFRCESEALYEVRPGFPRLVVSMLSGGMAPHGVHDVTYHIDLSVADPFLCDPTVMGKLEKRLCK